MTCSIPEDDNKSCSEGSRSAVFKILSTNDFGINMRRKSCWECRGFPIKHFHIQLVRISMTDELNVS